MTDESRYEWKPDHDPSKWLRRWRVQFMAEQRLVEQIRSRDADPRAFVRITG